MSRHDLKNKKLQVEIIEKREVSPTSPIIVKNPLLDTKEYDTSDQFTFVQSENLNNELCNAPTPSNESFIIV